jgi:DNA repair exonuclease SbcCD ATPase subunit
MSTLAGGVPDDDEPEELSMEPSITRRRAPRIMRADVFRAADELLVQGDRPSIDRVRMRIGRGSPNTINDHLDAWWKNLGARLRDLPGREFPQLPERVAQSLQNLWNEALGGAHEALQGTLSQREEAITQREQALDERTRHLTEREQVTAARTGALEEALALAREQLTVTNQRAQALEQSVQERATEGARLRTRLDALETESANWRAKLEAASAAHQAERGQLQERYAAAERHWLLEVDRARQHAKDAAKQHEHQTKELRRRLEALVRERDELRQNLLDTRAELKTSTAILEQLKEHLHESARISTTLRPKRSGRQRARSPRAQAGRRTPKNE